jgi:hypothetical protein
MFVALKETPQRVRGDKYTHIISRSIVIPHFPSGFLFCNEMTSGSFVINYKYLIKLIAQS